jgi:hypothetical protein
MNLCNNQAQQYFCQMNQAQPVQQVQQVQFDPMETAKDFCNRYYHNMANQGFPGVLNLFDPNASCNYSGVEHKGLYSVMVDLASNGICKTVYDNLQFVVLPIDQQHICIHATGLVKGLTFWNQYTAQYIFTEVFILSYVNNRVAVTSYVNKLI